MKRFHWRNLSCVAAVISVTGAALADEPVQVPRVTGTAPVRALSSGAISVAVVGGDVQELGKYWIGVSVADVGEVLRDQLDLQNGLGVVASDIVDKGPAQTAGILKHDILLKAGETELRSAKDLVAAVNKAETKDLAVELIRKGQRKTITVKPAERPASQGLVVGGGGPGVLPQRLKGPNGEEIEIRVGPGGNAFFVQPGVPLPMPGPGVRIANAPAPVPLPNGVSISISRTNNDPAKISVKRGAESWDITDKELDKLPPELRPHVERMLNPQPHPIFVPKAQPWQSIKPLTPDVVVPPKIDNEGAKKSDVDQLRKQLEELSRKLDQLNEKK